MTPIERLQANVNRLRSLLPAEGAKADPPPMGGAPGAPPVPPMAAKPPAPGAPAPGNEDEEDEDDGCDEGMKAFVDGCKSGRCGRCLKCIERGATAEAAKGAGDDGAVGVAQVPAAALAQLIAGAVATQFGPVREALKAIESQIAVLVGAADGQLDLALKSAEALRVISRQPAASPPRPGVAAGLGASNPASVRAGLDRASDGTFPLTEPELYKAVERGLMSPIQARQWWNAGHPSVDGVQQSVNVPPPPGVQANIVEALKAL